MPPVQKFFNIQEFAFVSDFHLQNEASKIKKEAEELDQLIARKLKDYEDLREDMKGKELEVKNLLEKGKTEQQVSSVLCRLLFPGKKKTRKQRKTSSWPRMKDLVLFSLTLALFVTYKNTEEWSQKGHAKSW